MTLERRNLTLLGAIPVIGDSRFTKSISEPFSQTTPTGVGSQKSLQTHTVSCQHCTPAHHTKPTTEAEHAKKSLSHSKAGSLLSFPVPLSPIKPFNFPPRPRASALGKVNDAQTGEPSTGGDWPKGTHTKNPSVYWMYVL